MPLAVTSDQIIDDIGSDVNLDRLSRHTSKFSDLSRGDVGNKIPKSIDRRDLSNQHILVPDRHRDGTPNRILDGRSKKLRRDTFTQPGGSRSKHISTVKGRSGRFQAILWVGDLPDLGSNLLFQNFRE